MRRGNSISATFAVCAAVLAASGSSARADYAYSGFYAAAKNRQIVYYSDVKTLQDLYPDPSTTTLNLTLLSKTKSSVTDIFAFPWKDPTLTYNDPGTTTADLDAVSNYYSQLSAALVNLQATKGYWSSDQPPVMLKPVIPIINFSRILGLCNGTTPTNGSGNVIDPSSSLWSRLQLIDCVAIGSNDPYREAFIREVKGAMQLAVAEGSPVIFFDHEAYVNYSTNLGALILDCQNTDPADCSTYDAARAYVLMRLNSLGMQLADLLADPTVGNNIDFLAAGSKLDHVSIFKSTGAISDANFRDSDSVPGIVTYYMLARAKSQAYTFKVYDGGENLVRYPKYSLAYSTTQLKLQENTLAEFTSHYPANFALAAPITFWDYFASNYSPTNAFMVSVANNGYLPAAYTPSTVPNQCLANLTTDYNPTPCYQQASTSPQITGQTDDVKSAFEDTMQKRKYTWIFPKAAGSLTYFYDVFGTRDDSATTAFTANVDAVMRSVKQDIRLYCSAQACN